MYGLGGTKSENVKKTLVLNWFLKWSKGARTFQECKQLVEKLVFGRKSDRKPSKKKTNESLDMSWQE